MFRRVVITASVGAIVLLLSSSLLATTPPVGDLALQDEETPLPAPVEHLFLGQRYGGDNWELEVQDAFLAASPDRQGYSDVRLAVAFRNLGGSPVSYEWAAMTGIAGFPELTLVDDAEEVWTITVTEPGNATAPGSNLVSLEPFVPGRWTIGFEVPTAQTSRLTVTAMWNGSVVADWDLLSTPNAVTGWDPPPDAEQVSASNPTIAWDDDIEMTVLEHGTLACGDSALGGVTTIFSMRVGVASQATRDVVFPSILRPNPTAIAVWSDGASARMEEITVAGFAPVDDPEGSINSFTHEQLIVPPDAPIAGVIGFTVPRDGRFGSTLEAPDMVIFFPPSGIPQWYDVAGFGTAIHADDFCDSYTNGTPFEVTR